MLFDAQAPLAASNRRISIIVMNRDAEDRMLRTAPELAQSLSPEEPAAAASSRRRAPSNAARAWRDGGRTAALTDVGSFDERGRPQGRADDPDLPRLSDLSSGLRQAPWAQHGRLSPGPHLPASPRKISKAREDGQVARSRDLSHFAAIAAGGALLAVSAPELVGWLQNLVTAGLQFDAHLARRTRRHDRPARPAGLKLILAVLLLGGHDACRGPGGSVISGGWNWTLKPLVPKFGKLNPIAGLGRMFSKQQLGDTRRRACWRWCWAASARSACARHCRHSPASWRCRCPPRWRTPGPRCRRGLVLLLLALALFAAIDVPLQRSGCRRLKMSHQEVKQEHKELEGNVEVKGKVQARMREMTQAPHDGRGAQGRPGGDEPDPLRGRAQVRRRRRWPRRASSPRAPT